MSLEFPDRCKACRVADAKPVDIVISVDPEGEIHKFAICAGCVKMLTVSLAHRDSALFETYVAEARSACSGPDGETAS